MSELACAAFAAATGHTWSMSRGRPATRRFGARSTSGRSARELATRGIRWLARSDPAFPPLLRAIHDPPPGLFLRGEGDDVPARGHQRRGGRCARLLVVRDGGGDVLRPAARRVGGDRRVRPGSRRRCGRASRCARGRRHRGGARGAGSTATIPGRTPALAERIAERGLIVSEYPPGVEPAPWRFPARNRIVAGLCRATVVVEARARSGALITADLALEEGREVLAVPGEITTALSDGTNALLRLGATPATRVEDVLEAVGVEPSPPEPAPPISETGGVVLAVISDGPAAVDDIVRRTGLTAAAVAAALAELELCGLVTEGDGIYRGVITGERPGSGSRRGPRPRLFGRGRFEALGEGLSRFGWCVASSRGMLPGAPASCSSNLVGQGLVLAPVGQVEQVQTLFTALPWRSIAQCRRWTVAQCSRAHWRSTSAEVLRWQRFAGTRSAASFWTHSLDYRRRSGWQSDPQVGSSPARKGDARLREVRSSAARGLRGVAGSRLQARLPTGSTSPPPSSLRSTPDGRAEVAVIGGGVTGCSCALTLAERGVRVRLYEQRRVAGGASGRNGGFASRGSALPYDLARTELGVERARLLMSLTERSLDRMERLAGDAFRRVGIVRLAADAEEADALRRELDALRADGFAVEWLSELRAPLDRLYAGAMLHPTDGAISPARWVRRLAQLAAEAGAEIIEGRAVSVGRGRRRRRRRLRRRLHGVAAARARRGGRPDPRPDAGDSPACASCATRSRMRRATATTSGSSYPTDAS